MTPDVHDHRLFALLAVLFCSQVACCIAVVSGDNETTTSGGGIANGGSTTAGPGTSGGTATGGGTGASSTTGGACTALDPSPLDFPVAHVGDCIFDPHWEPDGGPGLIAVSVILSTEPLTQDTFSCNTLGTSLRLNYGSPEFFDPVLVPGTYQIPGSIDGGFLMNAGYFPDGTLSMFASGGSVTFTSVSSSEVTGSFNVAFAADGGGSTLLSGTFCAPYFGNLNLPP